MTRKSRLERVDQKATRPKDADQEGARLESADQSARQEVPNQNKLLSQKVPTKDSAEALC